MAVTINPVGYPDGPVSEFTTIGGYGMGKYQSIVADRFIGDSFTGGFCTAYYNGGPTTRADHIISSDFIAGTSGDEFGLMFNIDGASPGSNYASLVIASNSTPGAAAWTAVVNGGVVGVSGAILTVLPGVIHTLSLDATTYGSPVVLLDGVDLGIPAGTFNTSDPADLNIGVLRGWNGSMGAVTIGNSSATVPVAPTTVVGSAGNGQAIVNWTNGSDGGSAITSYDVDWATAAAPTTWLGPVSAALVKPYTKTGLTNGTGYVFRVRAVNAVGAGAWSSSSSTVTPVDLSASIASEANFGFLTEGGGRLRNEY